MPSSPLRESGIPENLYGLAHREVAPGSGSRYLPLELIPARDYTENFHITGVGSGLSLDEMYCQVLFFDVHERHCLTKHIAPSGDQLQFQLNANETARLYTVLGRGREIGEWHLYPGPMATGPVSFKRPPTGRLPMWFCISPFGPPTREMVITLRGTDKGPYVEGQSYSAGDIVQIDGRYFYAFCDSDGSPGSGPNLDPNDPDSNTIIPDDFPSAVTDLAGGTDGAGQSD
jgi:hypothetical protein